MIGGGGTVPVKVSGAIAEVGEVEAGFEQGVEGCGGAGILFLGRGLGKGEGNGEALAGEDLLQGEGAVLQCLVVDVECLRQVVDSCGATAAVSSIEVKFLLEKFYSFSSVSYTKRKVYRRRQNSPIHYLFSKLLG